MQGLMIGGGEGTAIFFFYSTMTKIQALESCGQDIAWCGVERRKLKIRRGDGEGTKISVTSH